MLSRQGSFRIARLAGIDVFLHWSWFLVAAYEIRGRSGQYSSVLWNIAEYLALFAIVLMHEFGHALACRQVGGRADRILLWPFGGVAYVDPPSRAGATLWSIAAGPLVNVALAPLLIGALVFARVIHLRSTWHDAYLFLFAVLFIDLGLLVFNILPVYPLDGGQILRSLLWFVLGRGRSLMVASVIGFLGIVGLIVYAVIQGSTWTGLIAVYLLMSCWGGLQQSLKLMKLDKLGVRQEFACAKCGKHPPVGPVWVCQHCTENFDIFATAGQCPVCGLTHTTTTCVDCRTSSPLSAWQPHAATPPPPIAAHAPAAHGEG